MVLNTRGTLNNEGKQAKPREKGCRQITTTPLVFSTMGGMGEERARYHTRLVELLAIKKGETYSTTVSWIRAKVLFALLRGALLCPRDRKSVV